MRGGLDFYLDSAKAIVIVTHNSRAEAESLLATLRTAYVPNRVLLVAADGEPLKELARVVPLADGKTSGAGQAMAYVCRRGVAICQPPSGRGVAGAPTAQTSRPGPLARAEGATAVLSTRKHIRD